jgi:hypothetical protein
MALIELKSNLSANPDYNKRSLEDSKRDNAELNHRKFRPDEDQLIHREIGDGYRGTKLDGGFVRGGAGLQAERTAEDVERIGKFLFSPKGALFTIKQGVLQNQNKQRNANIYDPTSILKNLPSIAHFQRHINEDLFSEGLSLSGIAKQLIGGDADNQYIKFIKTKGDKFGTKYEDVVDSVTYFQQKGKKKLQVEYGDMEESKLPKDFIKFRIRDLVNGKWIIFPAFLTADIVDNSQASYEEINYIGRPDAVHIYKNMKRSFSVSFKVVATNKDEIPLIWKKIDRLKGLANPAYKPFLNTINPTTKQSETDIFTRPTAPMVSLTIGDVFKNTVGYFDSVSVTIPQASNTWELEDGRQFPHICDVALSFIHIGNVTPTIDSPNYGSQDSTDKKDIFIPETKDNTAASKEVEAGKEVSQQNSKDSEQQDIDKLSFGQAFSQKRQELGSGATFIWRGSSYSTNQAGE